MPVYDPKNVERLGNSSYLISLLEQEKEEERRRKELYPNLPKEQAIPEEPPVQKEQVVAEAPVKNRTITDLRNDEAFVEKGRLVFDYLNQNKNALQKIFTASSDYDADAMAAMRKTKRQSESPDIIEMLRDEDYRLPTLFSNAGLLEEAPEEVLRAYRDIRKEFDQADLGSFKEFMVAAKDIGTDVVTDPVNFLGLLAIPFTGGGSAAARVGAQQLAKTAVQRNLMSKLQAFATPTKVAALEGGVFAGLDDYGRQSRDIAVGLQETAEIDKGRVLTSIGLGVGLGAGLGKAVDLSMSALDKKFIKRAASSEETTSTDLAEQGMIGELVDAEGIGYGAERLGLDDDTSNFIEGVFEVIDNEEAVADLVSKFAEKKQISQEGAEELLDRLMDGFNPVQSKGGVLNATSKVINLVKQAPAVYGGKISTLLDPYVEKSDTVASLQRKFRYDMQRTFFGERTAEGPDYAETLGDTLGGYYTNMKIALEPVLQGNYGKNRDEAFLALSNAVRGKKSGDEVIDNAASLIRSDLDRAAKELQDAGLYDEASMLTQNYFPRMWNRKAIVNNQEEFARLLIKNGEAKDGTEAQNILQSMLSKNEILGDPASYGNFFLSKRIFNKIENDAEFSKFLDNDTQSVLLSYYTQISKQLARKKVFGASNWREFRKKYEEQIYSELGKAEGSKVIREDGGLLKTVWEAQTGEGQAVGRFQGVVDGVTTFNRLALLPLATVSSLTEILLNLSRGGVQSTVKNFGKATAEGAKILTYGMADRLVKNHNLSRPEAYRKMQRFGIALDQAASDQVERLSGESVKSPVLAKVNRAFFRLNLLEPWTKTVQLTSFNVGKDLIKDNLKAIARHGDKPMTARIQTKIDQLLELNVDVDAGLGWLNRTGGDLDADDKFLYSIERGAARYTNEIILNPTRESGLRSLALSKSPFTTMLFQLTTYPAAFTNTVLKDMVKRTARGLKQGDIGASGKVIGTALTMQAAAMTLNYVRNVQFNKDEEYKYKTDAELLREGLARWGGNGLHFDMVQRATRSSEIFGVPGAVFAAPLGPIGGQAVSAIQSRSLATPLASMTPFYAALPKETRAEIRAGAKQLEKDIFSSEEEYRYGYTKGGEVAIPRAAPEPDERIDKMTGQPYDKQAGTAFMDEEDPIRRLGFGVGGIARVISKPLQDIIQQYSKRIVSREEAEEAAEEIASRFRGSYDMPGEIDDPEFEDFLKLETKALLEEKHDLTVDQIKRRYPEFVDDDDQLIMGEAFSRARGYTDDEIETFQEASMRADEVGGSEVIAEIQAVLDSKKLTDKPTKPVDISDNLAAVLAKREQVEAGDPEDLMLTKTIKDSYKEDIKNLSPEDRDVLESMEVPSIPTRPEKLRSVDIQNRDKALKNFLKGSKEKEPMYRGTKHGYDTDYEMSFAMPQEIGTHVGTRGQATSILAVTPEKELGGGQALSEEVMQSLLAESDMSMPKAITKGYISVKQPLLFEKDFGNWSATEILTRPQDVDYIAKEVAKQSSTKGVTPEVVKAVLKRKTSPYITKAMDVSAEEGLDSLSYNIHNAKLNIEFRKVLESFGFDSIKYKNNFEARIKGESPYSYILFKPEQFKSAFASRFDKADPRQNKAEGSLLKDSSMYRKDGSKKSAQGFLGPVKNNVEGGTMTEVSVGVEINGKEVEVPAMVPTLTKKEIEALANMKLEGNAKNIPKSIMRKAEKHALQRMEKGLSPFYQDGE